MLLLVPDLLNLKGDGDAVLYSYIKTPLFSPVEAPFIIMLENKYYYLILYF